MTEDRFLALCDWIDQQIDQPIGWSELSGFCGADHMELQAAFAKYKATTPMTWIRKRRQELSLEVELQKTTRVKLPPFLSK
jgi:AraC-like DNA-binding protein